MKFIFILFVCVLLIDCNGQSKEKVHETWETANKTIKIRVTAYREDKTIWTGANYVFESASIGSNNWKKIMVFRHDDPVQIPRDQIRFLNDQVAYIFMGWMYAITTDSGMTWTIWDATKDLPNYRCCNYGLIKNVEILSDGTGKMYLEVPTDQGRETSQLGTRDYGRNWIR